MFLLYSYIYYSFTTIVVQVTGAVKHRPDGIKYKKNEVYLDLIENCNVRLRSSSSITVNFFCFLLVCPYIADCLFMPV